MAQFQILVDFRTTKLYLYYSLLRNYRFWVTLSVVNFFQSRTVKQTGCVSPYFTFFSLVWILEFSELHHVTGTSAELSVRQNENDGRNRLIFHFISLCILGVWRPYDENFVLIFLMNNQFISGVVAPNPRRRYKLTLDFSHCSHFTRKNMSPLWVLFFSSGGASTQKCPSECQTSIL